MREETRKIFELPTASKMAPDIFDEVEALTLEKLSLERDLLFARLQILDVQKATILAEIEAQATRGTAFGAQLRAKYQITEADRIDIDTRTIQRAPKDGA